MSNPTSAPLPSIAPRIGEAALLITCLRGLPFVIPDDMNWPVLLALAEENGVLLLVYQALLQSGVELPDFFTAVVIECKALAEKFAAELEELLQHFAERSIEVLPLKGPVLASAFYGGADLRMCNDLDLLVLPSEYNRAKVVLLNLGFTAGKADEYHCRFFRGEIPVELHHGIAKNKFFLLDMDSIWSRSQPESFRGQPMRAMSEDDLILYLCSHGLKHGFTRLVWILDIALGLNGLRRCSYMDVALRARQQDMEPWLLIGCEVVRAMFPQLLPDAMDAVIASTWPSGAGRARRAANKLFDRDMKDVVNDYRGFYLQAQPSALKRLRYRLRYLEPTNEDYRWAERHRIQPKFMIVLRPVRLLQKYGASMVWRILFPPQV